MPTTQIKPFDVFSGTKTAGQSTNNASTSFGCVGCVGCVPQQPASVSVSVSTQLSIQGLGGASIMRPL
jgi:hypothetical protein